MLRVLIVDDNRKLAKQIAEEILDNDIDCDITHNYNHAMKQVEKCKYNLIILDIALNPENQMDETGISILRTIRKSNPLIPVIMLSGNNNTETRVKCFEIGCDDYIEKPFHNRELIAIIKRHTNRSIQQNNTIAVKNIDNTLTYQNLTINYETQTISTSETTITNKKILIDLLTLFIRNQGKTFSRQLIYSIIWKNSNYDENTLSVHIHQIRKLLEKNPAKPEYLKTIRGVGYALEKETV